MSKYQKIRNTWLLGRVKQTLREAVGPLTLDHIAARCNSTLISMSSRAHSAERDKIADILLQLEADGFAVQDDGKWRRAT